MISMQVSDSVKLFEWMRRTQHEVPSNEHIDLILVLNNNIHKFLLYNDGLSDWFRSDIFKNIYIM